MSLVVTVDERDEIIGAKERDTLASTDIYRVAFVWAVNSKGEVLLAKRSMTKKKNPGVWGPAAAGTIEVGEDYVSNIVKEIQEELGVSVSPDSLTPGPKFFFERGAQRWFAQSYTMTLDVPKEAFVIQEEEVERVEWFTKEEIKRMIKESPHMLTPSASHWGSFLEE